jgi:hypothetical protein
MSAQSTEPDGYWFCPLFCFDANHSSIELAENIKIEKLEYLPSPIKAYLDKRKARSKDDFRRFLVVGSNVAKWVIWLPGSGDPEINPMVSGFPRNEEEETIIDLVTALRLCHSGIVTPGETVFFSLVPHGAGIAELRSPSYISMGDDVWFGEPDYILEDSDISKVDGLIKAIGTCKAQTSINIAIRRFNLSYFDDFESKLVDQMIAFESLSLGDDKELGYKLALRTAFLLTRDEDKTKTVFSDMKKAYELRGSILHGGKKVEWPDLSDITIKIEEYLRLSIKTFLLLLSKGRSLKEIRERLLDENILSNGELLTFKE